MIRALIGGHDQFLYPSLDSSLDPSLDPIHDPSLDVGLDPSPNLNEKKLKIATYCKSYRFLTLCWEDDPYKHPKQIIWDGNNRCGI